VQAAIQLHPAPHAPRMPPMPAARAVVQRMEVTEKSKLISSSSSSSSEEPNPYAYEELLSTVPKSNKAVDRSFDIRPAIGRLEPKISAKGWRRTENGKLYVNSSGATFALGEPDTDRIEGVFTDASGKKHQASYITYEMNRKRVEQHYMKSYPDRQGIGTLLCYEGLRYAVTQGCTTVFVSMANQNSAALLYVLTGDAGGGGGGSCWPCFLVTACAEARGLPGDCAELTTLRAFRDGYLRELPGGEEMVELYYQVAPPIVEALWASPDPAREFESLYQAIRHCVGLVEASDLEGALRFYREMVEKLAARFLFGEGAARQHGFAS
jgi:hypothetical protein